MLKSPLSHVAIIEVRYAETDAMGVVHHSVYPIWFEQSRTEIMRINNCPYHLLEKKGFFTPVIDLSVKYKQSCHYGDFAHVKVSLSRLDRLRVQFSYEILVKDQLCVTGTTTHVFLKGKTLVRKAPEIFESVFFPSL